MSKRVIDKIEVICGIESCADEQGSVYEVKWLGLKLLGCVKIQSA